MLSVMKAKLDASRTLLYETSRFVDIYKTYQHISEERKLDNPERDEMKDFQRLADLFTPLAKVSHPSSVTRMLTMQFRFMGDPAL